jgi:hypothetical protein
MKDILREVADHSLQINPGSKAVKQLLCRFDEEKCMAIREEINKLLAARFIREINHLSVWPTPCWSERKVGNGECVSITPA